jgi:nitrate/TMAO reductase-like tetraheme cytochrome c subunit
MKATKRGKILIFACLGAAVAGLLGTAGLLGVERLESRREFCNGCHLPGGRPLHEAKMRVALTTPPADETAVHFQRAPSGAFTCATCHRGEGLVGRGEVLWDSFRNSVFYLGGGFEEPKRMARPIRDRACTACHAGDGFQHDDEKFHGIRAHTYPLPVRCTECHVAHADEVEKARHVRKVLARLQSTCGKCHNVAPPTPDMVAVLQNFARAHARTQ